MPKVVIKENEVLDDALRRFKRQVSRNGTLAEARKREFYVKPGVRRKLKSEAARKLSLIHISEPTRRVVISYAVFCLKKIFFNDTATTEIYTRLFVGSVRCV